MTGESFCSLSLCHGPKAATNESFSCKNYKILSRIAMYRAALVRPVWRLGFARSCHDGQCFHRPMATATPARITVIRSTSQRGSWAGDSCHQGISYGLLQSQSQCGSSMRLHLVPKSYFEKKLSRKSWTQGLRCCATATEAEGEPKVRGSSPLLKWEKGGGMVHSLATVHDSAIIESGAIVEAHANIGANTHVSSGCIVGSNVSVGASSTLGYNVVLQNCSLGNSCILHPGVCIGQDGFGFLENSAGEIMKKPQLLRVQIGNHVEIGANSCIDRGSWRDTEIGDYTKIDNLVQIGHNAIIGRGCMLCGQVGVAGSATIGDYVVLGGKAGVSDHVSITSRVRVAAKSGVISSIDTAGDYAGFPAVPAKEWRKQVVAIRRVGRSSSKESILEAEE